jgi:hypothetical protein
MPKHFITIFELKEEIQCQPKVFDQFYISIKNYKLPGKNLKLILFDGYIHKVFFIHLAHFDVECGYPVLHIEHPVEIPVLPMCEPTCLY